MDAAILDTRTDQCVDRGIEVIDKMAPVTLGGDLWRPVARKALGEWAEGTLCALFLAVAGYGPQMRGDRWAEDHGLIPLDGDWDALGRAWERKLA